MLLVKTYIKEAFRDGKSIGFGLFADQDIHEGDIIWRLNRVVDKVIPLRDLPLLNELEQHYLKTYAYREGDKLILCSDNGKYINHSNDPNTLDLIDEDLGSITVAKTFISKDSEIVSDYRSFDDDSKSGEIDHYM